MYTVEISGILHSKFRRRRIFNKLFLISKQEWQKACPQEVLALCDHTSISGQTIMKSKTIRYHDFKKIIEIKKLINYKQLVEAANDYNNKYKYYI